MIILALFIYFLKLVGGFLLVHLIWDARELKALILKFFLGAGMGTGISSLLYFLWAWMALPAGIFPLFQLLLLVVLVMLAWWREPKQGLKEVFIHFSMPRKNIFLWGGLISLAVLLCIASFLIKSAANPHGIYDAWDIWNLGARFIYFLPDHWIAIIPQNAWPHADYPLLVALNVADGWSIVGSDTTRIPVAFSLFFMLSLVGLLFASLSISKDFQQGALAAIMVLSLPAFVDLGIFQYADIQLAYFFLATTVLFYLYTLEANVKFLFLAGLFAGFSGWSKNEGDMFIVFSTLVCLALSLWEKKNLLKYFIVGLLFPGLVIILFKSMAIPSDLFVDKAKSFQQLFDISRYQLIFVQLWEKMSTFGFWPVSFFLVLVLYTLLVLKQNGIKGKLWIPFCLFSFQFIGYFVIFLITPHDLYWHLDTALYRLIFQLLPLTIFWLFNLLYSPCEIFGERSLVNQ